MPPTTLMHDPPLRRPELSSLTFTPDEIIATAWKLSKAVPTARANLHITRATKKTQEKREVTHGDGRVAA